jgi:outer membrane protein assembly factor BamE
MQKLLISIVCGATLVLSACSSTRDVLGSLGAAIPNALARTPLMYRPDVQQGNVINPDTVNRLSPGMSKSQVRFLLGTPMVADVFHEDRWDYVYVLRKGNGQEERERLSVYFDNDRLVRIQGDYRPQSAYEAPPEEKERVVTVPDWEGDKGGLFNRALQTVGVGDDD